MGSVAYRMAGRVHVAYMGTSNPTDLEWNRYVNDLLENKQRIEAIWALTEGGGPDGGQRDLIMRTWKAMNRPRVAIMTRSAFARAIANALTLVIGPHIRVFAESDEKALGDFLLLDATERAAALLTLGELRTAASASPRGAERHL